MNAADLDILNALCNALARVAGLRTVRLAQRREAVELPLSRLPAAILEEVAVEPLTWPGVPAGLYRLTHWRLSVLDRAAPGTRAFESLVELAESAAAAISSEPALGGLAADGPASAREPALAPSVGATRLAPLRLAEPVAGLPTAVVLAGASGYWAQQMSGAAALDDEMLFSSGPHVVTLGSPCRRFRDQVFNGLAGGLTLDLGDGPREICQTGVLTAASAQDLAEIEAAIEAFIDGRTYTLTTPDGVDLPNVRMERMERLGPPLVAAAWHQPYRITYRQLLR